MGSCQHLCCFRFSKSRVNRPDPLLPLLLYSDSLGFVIVLFPLHVYAILSRRPDV